MKKIVFALMILFIGAGTMMAQTDKEKDKAAKKAEKEAKKAAEEAENMALFEEALKAMEDKEFVLEAERVEFKRGRYIYVTSNTNFVSMNGNKASIQLTLNGANPGPNGIGGITVDGTISNPELKTDKKGNISMSFMVQGIAVSANVVIRMPKGSNRCTAIVSPNFNSNRLTFTGYMYPKDQARIYKGRSF